MARGVALLSVGLVLLACSGCGEAPAANVAVANQGVAPKPAGPPAGMPGEPAVKPGTEVPVQLGGVQTKALLAGRTQAVSQPNTPATTETPAQPNTTTPSTPTQPTATDPSAPTKPADSAAPPTATPPSGRGRSRRPMPNQATPPADNPTPPAADPSAPTTPAPTTPATPAPGPMPPRDPSAPTTGPLAPKADSSDSTKAQAGVGAQGKDYGNADGGYISEPISTYFSAKELITFNIQLPNAMKMYKALHDGKNPKNQEEFQKEIIQENGIKLPELPEGSTYVYDPQTGELMVKHPKKK